jgi:hypothetical protein
VIIVVEGPSAAGKTTWTRARRGPAVLAEERYDGPDAEATDEQHAGYWARVNTARWARALESERRSEVVICDGDPLKLHYDYGLARLRQIPMARFQAGVAAVRQGIARRRLGIADLILCSIPDDATLTRQRDADRARHRSRFDLHRQLARPLHDWYTALDEQDEGRVVWSFPDAVPPLRATERYDVALYDAWIAALPWDPD